ncbi:MAG: T9SS type A sorting domain-containing protein [Bacteroidota bacterium]|nr:T9SS type A sorting domain-containing protein [Bacteroidota bacterium]
MAKQLQLTIPTPCHENWEAMTPVEKGRYCGACQKQVVDFSEMSDRQVAEFFKKPNLNLSKGGSVCGRFMQDQLDRDMEIPRRRIPWVKYFFQFALPAFLLSIKSSAVKAQGTVAIIIKNKSFIETPIVKKSVISDTITMPEVVILASVLPQAKRNEFITLSPLLGKVGGPVIVITDKSTDIATTRDLSFNPLNISRGLQGRVGGVSVKGLEVKEKKSTPLLQWFFKDTSSKFFKIFPNPVASGSNIFIECKQTKDGDYSVQLFHQSGQLVHQQKIWINARAKQLNVGIPQLTAGNYFLVLTNKKTGKKFMEKLIIQ